MRDIKKFLKPREAFNIFKKIPRQILIGAGLIMMAGLLIFSGVNSFLNPPAGYREFENGVLAIKNNSLDSAVGYFREAAIKGADEKVISAAYYNLGTICFFLALNDGSVDMLKKAIFLFQGALKQDPTNRDAKYNLELALRYLASAKPQEGEEEPGMNPGRQGTPDQKEPEW